MRATNKPWRGLIGWFEMMQIKTHRLESSNGASYT
jgi:hypothetical protein